MLSERDDREAILYRLLRKTQVQAGCWFYLPTGASPRYPQLRVGRRLRPVHRISMSLFGGLSLDDPLCVLHRCDEPQCWNPSHLFLGTQQDNIADAIAKGRAANCPKEFCRRGHRLTKENRYASGCTAGCLTCRRAADAANHRVQRQRRREAAMESLRGVLRER